MKGRYAAALVVLLAGCHFDKLFSGGGGQLSHGTPVALVFNAEPSSGAHAGEALTPPIRVAIVDSAGPPPPPPPAPPAARRGPPPPPPAGPPAGAPGPRRGGGRTC